MFLDRLCPFLQAKKTPFQCIRDVHKSWDLSDCANLVKSFALPFRLPQTDSGRDFS